MHKRADGRVVYPFKPLETAPPLCITNGREIDPAQGVDETRCVVLREGRVADLPARPPDSFSEGRVIDAKGMWVVPGLMDMHVHLREPGREDRETIASGTRAAAAGGFTAVACMPNTSPVLDEESKIRHVFQRGEECPCRIFPMGSITKGMAGEELSPFGEMVRAGAVAFTDDGRAVRSSAVMKNAFNYSKSFHIPLVCHSEDEDLFIGGHMNEGPVSAMLGLRGIPSIAEQIVVARDLMLAEYTGAQVHICHVSTAGSVELIRDAKRRGVCCTAETCPHYFLLNDEALITFDTHKKMNPPLRSEKDRLALLEGLADGTIDVIASDHAPHVSEDKQDVEFEGAAFGVIGLETLVGAALTALVHTDILMPADLIEKTCVAPRNILSIPGGSLRVGERADVTLIDPRQTWPVDPAQFFSKACNTPFEGFEFSGAPVCTILAGQVVYRRDGK